MAKLLLLDDDEEALTWMTAALESRGHEVRAYSDARSALAGLSTFTPNLIVSDILLPEMDGLAFARVVRRYGVPVMFVSIAKKEAEAVLAGAIGYVRKPATAEELRGAVERVLGRQGRRNTLLLVDDNEEVLFLYRTFLEPFFDILTAENGKVALAILKSQPVDLAIVDVHMPVMNGAELVRAMRADPELDRLPVVVQTSDRAALDAPIWSQLRVARVLKKESFVDWCEDALPPESGPESDHHAAPAPPR
jgi:CheY-like chemotaxis protein